MTANRLQRWATIFLSSYDCGIHYVRSKDHGKADGLSRLPIMKGTGNLDKEVLVKPESTYLNFVKYNMPCLNFFYVQRETVKDVVLSQVKEYCKPEWPYIDNENLKPFFNRKTEFYVEQDCLMLGNRVVVPTALRSLILTGLHSSHLGVVKMKGIARLYVCMVA